MGTTLYNIGGYAACLHEVIQQVFDIVCTLELMPEDSQTLSNFSEVEVSIILEDFREVGIASPNRRLDVSFTRFTPVLHCPVTCNCRGFTAMSEVAEEVSFFIRSPTTVITPLTDDEFPGPAYQAGFDRDAHARSVRPLCTSIGIILSHVRIPAVFFTGLGRFR